MGVGCKAVQSAGTGGSSGGQLKSSFSESSSWGQKESISVKWINEDGAPAATRQPELGW
ncbi:hypothetical protein Bpfe_003295 [Biomphalaria pfeifferi]|uniref:Uncharacterized protein n=1 Tax=Biomphalaria pfeifferi TaxID=112525 RepID=A0AAD8C659_BIOPF|nr:hypothetical protein Bpfe_003295 [Biomphalaria pfeifferi]